MIAIEVCGLPRPGGSKIPGMRKDGSMFVRPDCPHTSSWMKQVKDAALMQMPYGQEPITGTIEMFVEFRFPRPQKHFIGKSNRLRPDAPIWHFTKPDLTKVIRSTEDALTGVAWRDDCLVAKRVESKRYCNDGELPGVTIFILEMHNAPGGSVNG